MRPILGKENYLVMREFVVPLMHLIVKEWQNERDGFCHGAPLVLIFHSTPISDPADPHIAATYAMLAAEALSLGSCWIGTAVALNNARKVKEKYGIPAKQKVTGMLAIGHPAAFFKRSLRRELKSVNWN